MSAESSADVGKNTGAWFLSASEPGRRDFQPMKTSPGTGRVSLSGVLPIKACVESAQLQTGEERNPLFCRNSVKVMCVVPVFGKDSLLH